MGAVSLHLLLIASITSQAFKPDQLLKSYTVTSYVSTFSIDFNNGMVPEFVDGSVVSLRFVGVLKDVRKVAMTTSSSACEGLQESTLSDITLLSDEEATVSLKMPSLKIGASNLYFCLNTSNGTWAHQGSKDWAQIVVSKPILSLPLLIFLIIMCLAVSGLLNGLVLGLMSLDATDLRIIATAGGKKERNYGKAILSVRKYGNCLLISLVAGVACLNATVTVLINLFVSEWITILIMTVAVVICCEVIPDLVICWYALVVGAKTIYLTWTVMILTSPLSYPLGKLLDKILGKDIYNLPRNRLTEMAMSTQWNWPSLLYGFLAVDEGREQSRGPPSQRGRERDTSNSPTPDIPDAQPQYNEPSTGGDLGPSRAAYFRRSIRRSRGTTSPEVPHGQPTASGHMEERDSGLYQEPSTQTDQQQQDDNPAILPIQETHTEPSTGGDQGPSRATYYNRSIRRPRQQEPPRDEDSRQESSIGHQSPSRISTTVQRDQEGEPRRSTQDGSHRDA